MTEAERKALEAYQSYLNRLDKEAPVQPFVGSNNTEALLRMQNRLLLLMVDKLERLDREG